MPLVHNINIQPNFLGYWCLYLVLDKGLKWFDNIDNKSRYIIMKIHPLFEANKFWKLEGIARFISLQGFSLTWNRCSIPEILVPINKIDKPRVQSNKHFLWLLKFYTPYMSRLEKRLGIYDWLRTLII